MSEWQPIETAPEGVEIWTKIDDENGERNVQTLIKRTREPGRTRPLFFSPDGNTYVYYTPTHWKQMTRPSVMGADGTRIRARNAAGTDGLTHSTKITTISGGTTPMTDPKTHAQATICHGLTDDTSGLARFGWHPDPAIDFCVQVETLESRLHQAQHGLCKPGDEPETVENVLAAIERAMDFRVGGDEGAVNAKAILRKLETKARASLVPAPAVPDDVDWTTCGIVEIAARNPSVMEYMRHWEGRAEKAEAALENAEAELAQMREQLANTIRWQDYYRQKWLADVSAALNPTGD